MRAKQLVPVGQRWILPGSITTAFRPVGRSSISSTGAAVWKNGMRRQSGFSGWAKPGCSLAALATSGAEHPVVFGYVDQGGKGIIQTAVDTGAFEKLRRGRRHDRRHPDRGDRRRAQQHHGTLPGSATEGVATFIEHAAANGVEGDGPFRGQSHDAATLIVLAIQAAGSAERSAIQAQIMAVANAPGLTTSGFTTCVTALPRGPWLWGKT